MIQRIAVLTSGGDAPGMNAAIRSVVRCAVSKGWTTFGVRNGYQGLIDGLFEPMGTREVGGILQRGGTILGSARCEEFKTVEGRERAIRSLNRRGVDALVVIGGNGTQTGSYNLSEMGFPVVGIASTIDNDLFGSDITLGVDTALNIALEAIDRLKVTASSHQRAFIVEVMGRNCGYIALMSGLAGGAEAITLPEYDTDVETLAETLRLAYEHGKSHAIIVTAEGAKYNAAALLSISKLIVIGSDSACVQPFWGMFKGVVNLLLPIGFWAASLDWEPLKQLNVKSSEYWLASRKTTLSQHPWLTLLVRANLWMKSC